MALPLNDTKHRASATLFGLALGDALGAKTEFMNVEEILQRFPPAGPQEPEGNRALVTDDTQMALAVGKALLEAERPYTCGSLAWPVRTAITAWNTNPRNNRAP